MRVLNNKTLVKLIASVCIILTIFNFGVTNKVFAADEEEVWGGVLIKPITHLLTAIADAVLDILHESILSQNVNLIRIDGTPNWWDYFGKYVLGVLLTIVIAAALVGIGAIGVIAATALGKAIGVVFIVKASVLGLAISVAGGILIVEKIDGAAFPGDIYLPVYKVSPEEIFSNQLPLFDVNFFNPGTYTREEVEYVDRNDFDYSDGVQNAEEHLLTLQKSNLDDNSYMYSYIIVQLYQSRTYRF